MASGSNLDRGRRMRGRSPEVAVDGEGRLDDDDSDERASGSKPWASGWRV